MMSINPRWMVSWLVGVSLIASFGSAQTTTTPGFSKCYNRIGSYRYPDRLVGVWMAQAEDPPGSCMLTVTGSPVTVNLVQSGTVTVTLNVDQRQ